MPKPIADNAGLEALPHGSPIDHWSQPGDATGDGACRGYVICSTPRTGSYFLCDLLRSTGCLGRPHEYFGGPAMRRLGSPDYPLDFAGQIAAALRDGRTANGIFGVKLFAAQFAQYGSKVLDSLGDPLLVFLEREDALGQAISLTRAAKTNRYFASAVQVKEPDFDAALLRDYLELILRWNAEWNLYFARCRIVPLRLTYEHILAAPQASIDRLAAALDLREPAMIDPGQLSTKIQRDAISEQWRERFLAAQPQDLRLESLRNEFAITVQRRARRIARFIGLRRN